MNKNGTRTLGIVLVISFIIIIPLLYVRAVMESSTKTLGQQESLENSVYTTINVNGMEIVVADNTWMIGDLEDSYDLNNLSLAEAGKVVAIAIYEKYEFNLDKSRIEMIFWNRNYEENQMWSALVFTHTYMYWDRQYLAEKGTVPEFYVDIDDITGEILMIYRNSQETQVLG